jgi:demethylmenaquinone methyltransferase/2-methoxy-6-polyprenyl-1,4-benzoquinol methylase
MERKRLRAGAWRIFVRFFNNHWPCQPLVVNPFYESGAARGTRVNELFSRIAPRYDLINDLQSFGLHRYWKRRVALLADPKPGKVALDLCCGTGDLALALARHGARVVGVDFTERMLEVAQRRSLQMQAAKPEVRPTTLQFIQGDALRMPFQDQSFDLVTIAYGLRNLADLSEGLREMRRVAKPRARLLVLDFGKPGNALWRNLYFAYLRLFVPVLGRIFGGSAAAYAYILESLHYYPGQEGVAAQMRQLGLENVRVINLLGGVMGINYAELPG